MPGAIRDAAFAVFRAIVLAQRVCSAQTRGACQERAPDHTVPRAKAGMQGPCGLEQHRLEALRRVSREQLTGLPSGFVVLELAFCNARPGTTAKEVHVLVIGVMVEQESA